MSQEYHRKATFKKEIIKGQPRYAAVNKRAHYVVKKLGGRKFVSPERLKASKGNGSYKFYVYTAKGLRAL